MSKAGQPFKPLLAAAATRPKSSWFGSGKSTTVLRDNFDISTWLAMGALAQGSAFLLLGRIALLPAFLLIAYRLFSTYLQVTGYTPNPHMSHIIPNKFSAQMPLSDGTFSSQPADSSIVVFHIGTRSNHPLGILAPGFKEMGGFFASMTTELESRAEEFGFLGMTSWINASDRSSTNGLLEVGYFRSIAGLQAFAHSDVHRKAWDWWNKTIKQHPYISINHETFEVPRGAWENIYVQSHRDGMASMTFKAVDERTEEVRWVSPVVDASRGVLRSATGRIARGKGDENESYEEGVY